MNSRTSASRCTPIKCRRGMLGLRRGIWMHLSPRLDYPFMSRINYGLRSRKNKFPTDNGTITVLVPVVAVNVALVVQRPPARFVVCNRVLAPLAGQERMTLLPDLVAARFGMPLT